MAKEFTLVLSLTRQVVYMLVVVLLLMTHNICLLMNHGYLFIVFAKGG